AADPATYGSRPRHAGVRPGWCHIHVAGNCETGQGECEKRHFVEMLHWWCTRWLASLEMVVKLAVAQLSVQLIDGSANGGNGLIDWVVFKSVIGELIAVS